MLSDPIVLNHVPTVSITGGFANSFRRVANGKYICADGTYTLDEQARLIITPTIKPTGYNTLRFRLERDKNVAASLMASAPPADDTLTVDIIVKMNPRSHDANAAQQHLRTLFQVIDSNFARLATGES